MLKEKTHVSKREDHIFDSCVADLSSSPALRIETVWVAANLGEVRGLHLIHFMIHCLFSLYGNFSCCAAIFFLNMGNAISH
jgi:hypothetical protein